MEFFKDIKVVVYINYDAKKIEEDKRYLKNAIHIASHEYSRKSMCWELIEYPAHIFIPDKIANFLKEGFYLAGGAIVDLINNRQPKDWDLFILTTTNLKYIQNFGEYETINSISAGDIQIIKRIYNSPAEIIGGFDLDASRFIMGNDYKILCTPASYLALKNKEIYLNLNCKSETFGYRLNKYKMQKGFSAFSIDYVNTRAERSCRFDYGICLKSNPHIKQRTTELRENFMFLMKEQYSRLYRSRNNIFTIKDFENLIKYIYTKEVKNGKSYFQSIYSGNPYNPRFVSYCQDKGIKPFRLVSVIDKDVCLNFGDPYKKYTYNMSAENMKKLRLNCLHIRYHYYEKITTYKISNVSSQFTGSFYPVPYKYKCNLLNYLPEILPIYFGLKKILPKYLIYIILMFFYNSKILEN